MVHDVSMAVAEVKVSAGARRLDAAMQSLRTSVQLVAGCVRDAEGEILGEALIQIRDTGIDPLEAAFARGVRRFDKSGEYRAEGALSITEWLRSRCKLSGGAAAQRVEVARQLEKLPKTEAAFASGAVGYQHVAVIAHAAGHVGASAVRQEEASLLQVAQTMDPGTFVGFAKSFEHRVDAAGALAEANHAYQRRYFHLGEPQDGMVRLDGILDVEGGATLKTALNALLPAPGKDDERTSGQRRADALVELGRRGGAGGKRDGAGPRPQLIIRATVDTLAGTSGAPAGQLEGGGTVPAETVQRIACDSAISRITGQGELEHERNRATRTLPPSTRRALESRDRHCVFPGCTRPLSWCDGHHLVWWTRGGATALPNLAMLCRPHHRMVHEEGWRLVRHGDRRFSAIPPPRPVMPRARSD